MRFLFKNLVQLGRQRLDWDGRCAYSVGCVHRLSANSTVGLRVMDLWRFSALR
jgi:hypothetical protein